jgi:hypothetical protein
MSFALLGPSLNRLSSMALACRTPHLIVLPLHEAQDSTSARFASVENGEIRYSQSNVAEWSRAELDRMAKKLRGELEKVRSENER